MTDTADPEIGYIEDAPANGNGDGSMLDRLRVQLAEAKPSTLDIAIPNGDVDSGDLRIIMRLRRIPWKGPAAQALHRLQRAAANGPVSADAELGAECDLLIVGLEQLYGQYADDTPRPLDPEAPMRFDQRLAEALGLQASKARDVIQAVFRGDEGQFALKAAAGRYLAWLQQLEVVHPDEGKG